LKRSISSESGVLKQGNLQDSGPGRLTLDIPDVNIQREGQKTISSPASASVTSAHGVD